MRKHNLLCLLVLSLVLGMMAFTPAQVKADYDAVYDDREQFRELDVGLDTFYDYFFGIKSCTFKGEAYLDPAYGITGDVEALKEHGIAVTATVDFNSKRPFVTVSGRPCNLKDPNGETFYLSIPFVDLGDNTLHIMHITVKIICKHTNAAPACCCRGEYCSICGFELTASDPNNHNYQQFSANDPTCRTQGNREYWQCSDCGKYFSYDAATGTYTETPIESFQLPSVDHTYNANHDNTSHWEECIWCGTVKNTTSHTTQYTADASTHTLSCTGCTFVQAPESHSYGDWTVTKEATATETGQRERTCTLCGYTETEAIAPVMAEESSEASGRTDHSGTSGSNGHSGATESSRSEESGTDESSETAENSHSGDSQDINTSPESQESLSQTESAPMETAQAEAAETAAAAPPAQTTESAENASEKEPDRTALLVLMGGGIGIALGAAAVALILLIIEKKKLH